MPQNDTQCPFPRHNENFAHTSKKTGKNSNKTLPAVHHYTQKVELVPDILWPDCG